MSMKWSLGSTFCEHEDVRETYRIHTPKQTKVMNDPFQSFGEIPKAKKESCLFSRLKYN